jgi:hypothetical protein
MSDAVCLSFQDLILHHGKASAEWIPDSSRTLLQHVGELMRQQSLSL